MVSLLDLLNPLSIENMQDLFLRLSFCVYLLSADILKYLIYTRYKSH